MSRAQARAAREAARGARDEDFDADEGWSAPADHTAESDAAAVSSADSSAGSAASEVDGGDGRRTDWREGGRTVRRWRESLLAIAFVSLGVGMLAATAVREFTDSPVADAVADALVWLAMLVPVVWGLLRSRPAGLLGFRPLDLLYGVTLGLLLRMAQGFFEVAAHGSAVFPSVVLIDGQLPVSWWLTDAIPAVVLAPVAEELFFHGVILVALYTVLRRPAGKTAAGVGAVLISSGLFVVMHVVAGAASVDAVLALALLGLVTGTLVALTGRICAAILVHAVYNLTWVALAAVAAVLA